MPQTGLGRELTSFVATRELHEPLRTLDQYGKVFSSLVEHSAFQGRDGNRSQVLATLGGRSSSSSSSCPCRASRQDKHPWKPTECAVLELAVKGHSSRTPEGDKPTPEQLEAVRQRLLSKGYESLRAHLKSKGWNLQESYPGPVSA